MLLQVATPADLRAYLDGGKDAMCSALGVRIPAGWPEFPWVIEFTLRALEENPGQAEWMLYYFLDQDRGVLVGSGGFKGPPQDGAVEIGYEIAPACRGRGYATDAARQLVGRAFAVPEVGSVEARTLPSENASTAVLRKAGFAYQGTVQDSQVGLAWLWRITRSS